MPSLPTACIPTDAGEVVIEANWAARRDGYGRVQFFAYWWPGRFWNLDEPSAQVFVARPEDYAAQWEAEGKKVRVLDA